MKTLLWLPVILDTSYNSTTIFYMKYCYFQAKWEIIEVQLPVGQGYLSKENLRIN